MICPPHGSPKPPGTGVPLSRPLQLHRATRFRAHRGSAGSTRSVGTPLVRGLVTRATTTSSPWSGQAWIVGGGQEGRGAEAGGIPVDMGLISQSTPGWIQVGFDAAGPGARTFRGRRRCRAMCAEPAFHIPVLTDEVVDMFRGRKIEVFVDGTVGAGGHAAALMESCEIRTYIGLDQDATALQIAKERLSKSNFRHLREVLRKNDVEFADGILLDIGVSTMQIDTPSRGFSFQANGPLDMRMNQSEPLTAAEVVNSKSETEIRDILWEYGEEPQARRMARNIVSFRETRAIETTYDLSEALLGEKWADGNRPRGYPFRIHPATRAFQALRIFVNRELETLEGVLPEAIDVLQPGSGRLAVITFHSLEDRIVKQLFRSMSTVSGGTKDLTRRPIGPQESEVGSNPRSRSAKLRAVERLRPGEDPRKSRNKYPRP